MVNSNLTDREKQLSILMTLKKRNVKGCKYLRQPAVSFFGTPGMTRRRKKRKINSSKMEGNKRERGAATTGELNE
jgi:hypothetical protein